MAKTTEQLIAEMLDREAIRDLPARYCHFVWTRDVESIVGIFTEDGLLSIENDSGLPVGGDHRGSDALRALFGAQDNAGAAHPFIHNHVVELSGADRATGVCYVEVRAVSDLGSWTLEGFYHDDYVKDDGRWKFKARRLQIR